MTVVSDGRWLDKLLVSIAWTKANISLHPLYGLLGGMTSGLPSGKTASCMSSFDLEAELIISGLLKNLT